jgi:hypothetical protein
MMPPTDALALMGLTLAALAGVASTRLAARSPKRRLMFLYAAVAAALWLPWQGLPLVAYVRGLSADLSVTTLVLAFYAACRPFFPALRVAARERRVLQYALALTALVFYPLALGVGTFDPYRLGFGEPVFLSALFLLALAAWWRRFHFVAACLALAVLAWAGGWRESGNLWDALLDPWISLYALGALARRAMARGAADG